MFYLLVMVPGSFEFGRSEITQGRMNAFVPIDLLDPVASIPMQCARHCAGRCEMPDLCVGVGKVLIVRKIHLLFFDGADDPFRIRVLGRLADLGHAGSARRGRVSKPV